MTEDLAPRFMQLFAGRESWYGSYDTSNPTVEENGKSKGQAVTLNKPVTLELWVNHLEGVGNGLGIVPIRDDATCVFGALDIDSYIDFDPAKTARKVAELQLPLVVCRSKSGGAHLYLFAGQPVNAEIYRKKLKEIAMKLGLDRKTEVFPKQNRITSEKDAGSWINAPYFSAKYSTRYAYDAQGAAMDVEGFLDYAEGLKQNAEFFTTPLKAKQETQHAIIPHGPPCLQQLVQVKVAMGGRNDGLLNFAIYRRKAFPEDWQERVREDNRLYFDPPMDPNEVEMVINSAEKNPGYIYTCSRPPISEFCDGATCATRKHGIGRVGNSSKKEDEGEPFPELGQLRKLNTQPPTWFWDLNGTTVEFTSEELITPKLFLIRAMNVMTIAPTMPIQSKWTKIVNEAMGATQFIEAPEDSSVKGFFLEMLERFCTGRAQAKERDEVLMGRPFTDIEAETVWFRMQDLVGFLSKHRFNSMDAQKITALFHTEGYKFEEWEVRGRKFNVWGVPLFAATKVEKKEEKVSEEAIL